jgi:excisionase family DNA binding protein
MVLDPKGVADALGVSQRTAQRLMASGQIVSFRVGAKLWRCQLAAVEIYLAGQLARYRRAPAPKMAA